MPSLGKNSAEWPWGQAATGRIHPEKSHQKSWAESVVRLLTAMDSSPLRQLLCYLSYTAGKKLDKADLFIHEKALLVFYCGVYRKENLQINVEIAKRNNNSAMVSKWTRGKRKTIDF